MARSPIDTEVLNCRNKSVCLHLYNFYCFPSIRSSIFQVLSNNEYPVGYHHFERPPFNVLFRDKGDGKEFVASGLHAKADHAVTEIDRMTEVYSFIETTLGTSNVVLMGDFNADCSYVGSGDWSSIRLWTDSRFNWLIDNYADTTVSNITNCAYDRSVYTQSYRLRNHLKSERATIIKR
ncbi:Deoxyribonuclease-1-like 2 [Holothuria leucospilota]|uniref:Deoxyribonuclease-1-like 2 n=1 Tax=Holothuria leucospilota TaxID=206669 RepID=A0A9Q1H6B5_HOLLE|nr:Deoxyribonuclease-1-like 2 [Holothuria leucospilota]